MMLSPAEIEDMRGTLEQTMPESAVVFKMTRTEDSSGGFSEVWAAEEPTIARVSPLAGGVGGATAEVIMAGRLGSADTWMITMPVDTDVDETDRIQVGDRFFEVTVLLGPRTWEISRRILAVEFG